LELVQKNPAKFVLGGKAIDEKERRGHSSHRLWGTSERGLSGEHLIRRKKLINTTGSL